MTTLLLAQTALPTLTLVQWLTAGIILIAVLGIFWAFVKYSGINVPPLFITVFWIVAGAIVCIAGVRIVMSMW